MKAHRATWWLFKGLWRRLARVCLAENLRHRGHLVLPASDTPLCNLWLTLLSSIGIERPSFGDSTGCIEQLLA